MSEINLNLDRNNKDNLLNRFDDNSIDKAKKLLMLSRVTISFQKGDLDKFLIVSGIVKESTAFETKVVYKKRLEDSDEGPLTSSCSCQAWSETGHCHHVASLFIYYLISQNSSVGDKLTGRTTSPMMPFTGGNYNFGVSVDDYGTIIMGPHKLVGAPTNPTYSSMQYILSNRKVVNFPIPTQFNGKLVINFKYDKFYNELTKQEDVLPSYHFAYRDEENNLIPEISLFENLYLFNWKDGTSFHLPKELKGVVQKFKILKNEITIDQLIRMSTNKEVGPFIELLIDDQKIEEIPTKEANCFLNLTPNAKKGVFDLSIQFQDEAETLCPIPEFLSAFTFEGGNLTSFKKKKDAYSFITSVADYFEVDSDVYKVKSLASSQRDFWVDLVSHAKKSESLIQYGFNTKTIYKYDAQFIREIFKGLVNSMEDQVFRFTRYDSGMFQVVFTCNSAVLFRGLNQLNSILKAYGVSIFYDRSEISRWNGKMKFERKDTGLKWFDLELSISDMDMEILKNADLEAGISVTQNGIVLLDEDQKDLAKFMKRYISQKTKSEVVDEEFEKFVIPFNQMRIFELFELKRLGVEGALTKDEEDLCHRLASMEEMPQYDIPENLQNVLRPYQKIGYNWLRFLYEHQLGACLADDMGLGKTIQTIAFLKSVFHQVDKVLIVCPVTILINWEKEIEKFSDLQAFIYHGGARQMCQKSKIILTSYGVMKKESETTFKNMNFDVLILDEVQHLKNIRSLGAFAARKLNAKFRICLTGTPVENDLAEFYNIIDLCAPGIWGDMQFVRSSSTKKTRSVARKTASPFILRRTKNQVLSDLPPKIENNVYLEFTEDERKNYISSLVQIRNQVFSSSSKRKYGEVLRGLLKLRQNCLWQNPNDPLDNKITSYQEGMFSSTKINFVLEQLEQILEEGHQAIVFSQFTTYLDMIQHFIREKHWKLSRIDGTQSTTRRQREVDDFQSGKTSVFLISLKAGGVGLNLTAASYVFVMDPWWNPAVERQAIDRAHRIGQKNTLTIYRPIMKDSVEEKVLKLQQAKRELFLDLLPEDDDHQFSGKLTMTDFEQLLK